MSMIIYVHHTHPYLRWYPDLSAWRAAGGATQGTAHARFVWPLGPMMLWIMEHNAHHAAPGVPFHNLAKMQKAMSAHENFLTWPFTFRGLARVCAKCKLYDYAGDEWVTFAAVGPRDLAIPK